MPIDRNVYLGHDVVIPQPDLVNLYGCVIGDGTKIGAFVEIQKGVRVGQNCKISSHSFVCEGVCIENEVFIGHGVVFINDKFPRATTSDGQLKNEADWSMSRIIVRHGASIGSGAIILGDVIVGAGSIVGAGAVVTDNILSGTIVAGNPARFLRNVGDE